MKLPPPSCCRNTCREWAKKGVIRDFCGTYILGRAYPGICFCRSYQFQYGYGFHFQRDFGSLRCRCRGYAFNQGRHSGRPRTGFRPYLGCGGPTKPEWPFPALGVSDWVYDHLQLPKPCANGIFGVYLPFAQ